MPAYQASDRHNMQVTKFCDENYSCENKVLNKYVSAQPIAEEEL
ncbi:hypothetical protein ABEW05_009103 [Botrytis cinerea]